MTTGLVLTDVLDINRTRAMDQDLYHHKTLLGGWTPEADFDLSRPLWSKPEVRCLRLSTRTMAKIYNAQAENPMPPRVGRDNPRSGKQGRGMKTQGAYDTTLRIMLDPDTVNTDVKYSKRDRAFFSQYSEEPAKKAEWRKR